MKATTVSMAGACCLMAVGTAVAQYNPASIEASGVRDKTPVVYDQEQLPQGVLYDTMAMVPNCAYDVGNGDTIGGFAIFGVDFDLQIADDVKLQQHFKITEVQAGYVGFLAPEDGSVMIEIFQELQPCVPEEWPVESVCVKAAAMGFTDCIFGLVGVIYTANTAMADLYAGPGNWWFAMQPITAAGWGNGDWHYIVRDLQSFIGCDAVGRDSGVDHLAQCSCAPQGLGGGYGTNDWLPMGAMGFGVGDSALKISGDPWGLALNITGCCPGTLQVCVTGARPGDKCYIIYGFAPGATPVPGCPGLSVDIAKPKIAGSGKANEDGKFCMMGTAPPAACGRALVQGIDRTGCAKTQVIKL